MKPLVLIGWCLLLAGNAVQATTLPTWEELEYEQKAFWVTATSVLRLHSPAPDNTDWRLTSRNSVASNSEEIVLLFEPGSGASVSRERTSVGSDKRRFKAWDYLADRIIRVRRAPAAEMATDPHQWPLKSRRELNYPELPCGAAVIDPMILLWLAAAALDNEQASPSFETHTDLNFYRVTATAGAAETAEFEVELPGGKQREVIPVSLHVSPLGVVADDPDFSLLGLSGAIVIYFDHATRLPLLIKGDAPRIGSTQLELKRAILRGAST